MGLVIGFTPLKLGQPLSCYCVVEIKALNSVISVRHSSSEQTSNSVTMPTSRSYQEYLIESLKDPDEAAAYLEAALEEGDDSLLQIALKNVIEAKIALNESNDADNSLLELQGLIEQLTEQPKLNLLSWFKVLNALGLKLSITPSRSEHQVA